MKKMAFPTFASFITTSRYDPLIEVVHRQTCDRTLVALQNKQAFTTFNRPHPDRSVIAACHDDPFAFTYIQ